MAEFVLDNNIFEFNSMASQQKSGTTLGTKLAPPMLASTWMRLNKSFQKRKAKDRLFG